MSTYCGPCGGEHRENHALARLRWAARTACHAEPKTFTARCRLLWHDFVLHGLLDRGTERCQDCGRAYGGWWADERDWHKVMGGPVGLLCEPCFHARLGAVGGEGSGADGGE